MKHPRRWALAIDVLSKLIVAGAAAVAAWIGVVWNDENNKRNRDLAEIQTRNQVRSVDLQERLYQAQVVGNMMPYLNCKNLLANMSLRVIHNAAPMYEVDAIDTLSSCAKTREEKIHISSLKEAAQGREIELSFFRHLKNAEQYFHVGLDEEASDEYELAYQGLPINYDRLVDHTAAEKARQFRSNEQFHAAAQSFDTAFQGVPNSTDLGRK